MRAKVIKVFDRVSKNELISIVDQAWRLRPHLRLGQLIYNSVRDDPRSVNLYDYEDTDLANRLAVHYGLDKPSQEVVSFNGDVVN